MDAVPIGGNKGGDEGIICKDAVLSVVLGFTVSVVVL